MRKIFPVSLFAVLATALLSACSDNKESLIPEQPEPPGEPWVLGTDEFEPQKPVALLDLILRNWEQEDGSENGRNLYSAEYMLEVVGMPFFIAQDFGKALDESGMLLLSSLVKDETFTPEEPEVMLMDENSYVKSMKVKRVSQG